MTTDGDWTTRRLLAWMGEAFTKASLDSPRLFAEMLLAHVLGCDRLALYTQADRPATPLERSSLRDLVGRALKNEPVQYLVGEAWFFGLPFVVDRRVLVPRPSTETIVETAIQHCRSRPGFGGPKGDGVTIADACTGSGAIAVVLLKNLPGAHAAATDISADALAVARANAERHKVADRLDLLEGDLLEPLMAHPAGHDLHFLLANPPYISDAEWAAVPPNVKEHEPHLALRGGADGMTLVRRLLKDGPDLLRPGGLLMIELAAAKAADALESAAADPRLASPRVADDHEGLPRVLIATRA